jgi:hypothetical protein
LKYKTCLTAWAYILNFLESHWHFVIWSALLPLFSWLFNNLIIILSHGSVGVSLIHTTRKYFFTNTFDKSDYQLNRPYVFCVYI